MAAVTMIITAYGRSQLLARSLERFLVKEGMAMPAQILVIDDGSTDTELAVLCEHLSSVGMPIGYIYHDHPGWTTPCQARNIGLRHAIYDEILTCEPEVMFTTDVVRQLLDARLEFPDDCLFGRTWHANERGAGIENATLSEFPYYLLMRRDWLEAVGGWDEAFPRDWAWDDIDLEGRLRYNGHAPRLIPGVEAFHQWHPSRIEPAVENEAYARAKELPRDLIANRGAEWIPITRS